MLAALILIYDEWATSTPKEAARLGIIPNDNAEELVNTRFGASGYKWQGLKVLKSQELDMETTAPMEILEKAR
jgi:hypothetical protein